MQKIIFYDIVKNLAKEQGKTIEGVVSSPDFSIGSYYSCRKCGYLPRADIAVGIAKTLGTTVEYLVTGNKPFSEDSFQGKKDMYQLLEELEKAIKQKKEKFR